MTRMRAVLFVVLLLTGALGPLVQSNLNRLLPERLDASGRIPGFGIEELDAALAAAAQQADEAAAPGDALLASYRQEPQIPATMFADGFEADSRTRLKGPGEWSPKETGPTSGWHLAPEAASEGQVGFAFGDATGYPMIDTPERNQPYHAYLVSPRINLQSIQVQVRDTTVDNSLSPPRPILGADDTVVPPVGPLPGTEAETSALTRPPESITLNLQQSYNFGYLQTTPGPNEEPAIDGGQVLVYVGDTPPTFADLLVARNLFAPELLFPGSQGETPRAFEHGAPAEPGSSFTPPTFLQGANLATHDMMFSLNPFAGKNVYIVLRASVLAQASPQDYFTPGAYFPPQSPFYGWRIDNVTIEGPGKPDQILIDRWLNPPTEPHMGGRYTVAPGPDQDPLQLVVLNRGQVTADILAEVRINGPDLQESTLCEAGQPDPRLRPGQSAVLNFTCPMDQGVVYTVDAYVAGFGSLPFSDDMDAFEIMADRGLDIRAQAATIEPRLGDSTTLRRLEVPVENRGMGRERITSSLTILQAKVDGDVGFPGWVDVTDSAKVAIQPHVTELTLERPSGDERNRGTLAWSLLLNEAGDYQAIVDVRTLDGKGHAEAKAIAGTLVANGELYRDNFLDVAPNPSTIVIGDPSWVPFAPRDAKPPATDGALPTGYWELGPVLDPELRLAVNRTGKGVDGANAGLGFRPDLIALRGEPSIEALPDPNTQIATVQVRFTQYLDRMACDIRTLTLAYCGSNLAPEPRHQVRLHAASLPEISRGTTTPLVLWENYRVSSSYHTLSPMGNEVFALQGQWIEHSYQIPVTQFSGLTVQGSTVPAAALAGMSLEFVQNDDDSERVCPLTVNNTVCPTWRVSFAQMAWATADGQSFPVLRTDGAEDDMGVWTSYAGTRRQPGVTVPPETGPATGCRGNPETLQPDAPVLCGIWTHKPLAEPSPPTLWRMLQPDDFNQDKVVQFLAGGAWSISDASTLEYPDGAFEFLVGPAITIPGEAPDPMFKFQHRFQFAKLIYPAGAAAEGLEEITHYRDSGGLMVRFVEPTGPEATRPTTPFFPVLLQDRDIGDLHRYTRSDCDHAYAGVDPKIVQSRTKCLQEPLRDRANRTLEETVFLKELRILDYRSKGPVDADLGPDPAALRELDLRSACNGPCTVQFAFAAQTADPRFITPGLDASIKRRQSIAEAQGAEKKGLGWFIDNVYLSVEENPSAHDLALVDGTIHMPYDRAALGVGPGSRGVITVTVENKGLFAEQKAQFTVLFNNTQTGDKTSQTFNPPADFLVPLAGSTLVDIPFVAPATPGEYHFAVEVQIPPVPVRPGLFIKDEGGTNNCLFFAPSSVSPGECNQRAPPTFPIIANPDLDVDLTVTPLAGRTDYPREVVVILNNTGNMPIRDALAELSIQSDTGRTVVPQDATYRLKGVLEPGQRLPWQALQPTKVAETGKDYDGDIPPVNIVLSHNGGASDRFLVGASVGLEGKALGASSVLVEGFQTFFADDFNGGPPATNRRVASSQLQADPAWALASAKDRNGQGAWHFGNLTTGRYPSGVLATLDLPPLDLSAASQASLSFTHKYDFETFQDGGRVEAQIGDGPWTPLIPVGGYPGSVVSANPFNPTHDPSLTSPAFTGNSTNQFPGTKGWMTSEFSFGQLPGMARSANLLQLTQDGFSNTAFFPQGAKDPLSYSTTWRLPGQPCPDGCWLRENLHRGVPAHNPSGDPDLADDKQAWYTGTIGSQVDEDIPPTTNTYRTWLLFNVTLPQKEDGAAREDATLEFWYWNEGLGTLTVKENITGTETTYSSAKGWQQVTYPVSHFQAAPKPIELGLNFTFVQSELVNDNVRFPAMGAVLDDVRLRKDRVQGTQASVSYDRFDTNHINWNNTQLGKAGLAGQVHSNLNWTKTAGVPATPEGWGLDTALGPGGRVTRHWLFGDPTGSKDHPASALERLVTPILSLKGVGGDQASLRYWESHDMEASDERRTYLQVFQSTLQGDEPGAWVQVEPLKARTDAGWDERVLDLSPFIGQQVRLAFEAETDRVQAADPKFWRIDGLGIDAETLVGAPVQVRIVAGTDGSLGSGGWTIDDLQVVGQLYNTNLAILPDDPARETNVSRTGTVRLTGEVRNLGLTQATGLRLALDSPASASVQSIDGPAAPFVLAASGRPGDRARYEFEVTFPGLESAIATVPLRLHLLKGDSPISDQNLGDHDRTLTVHVEDISRLGVKATHINLPNPLPGENVTIAFDLVNDGTLPANVDAGLIIRSPDGNPVLSEPSLSQGVLEPGAAIQITHSWIATGDGLHRVEATGWLTPTQGEPTEIAPLLVGYVLVGPPAIYLRDGFDGNPAQRGWSARSNPTNSPFIDGSPHDSRWHPDPQRGSPGAPSYAAGPLPSLAAGGASYRPNRDEVLLSSRIDLRNLAALRNAPDSPLVPVVAYQYTGGIGRNDGMILQVTETGADLATIPPREGAGIGALACGNPCNPLARDDPKVRAVVESATQWRQVVHPLEGQDFADGTPLLGERLQLAFRFVSDRFGQADGIALDAVSVSAVDLAVVPASQQIVLRNGADKTYSVLVTNTGAVNDTYTVSSKVQGAIASSVTLTLPESSLQLLPGESAQLDIGLAVPDKATKTFSSGTIELIVQSTQLPERQQTARLEVLDFRVDPLPDLQVDLRLPDGKTPEFVEGVPTTLGVRVRNVGTAASLPTSLLVAACPDLGTLATTLEGCRDALQSGGDGPIVIELLDLEKLLPSRGPDASRTGTEFSYPIDWTPTGLAAKGEEVALRVFAFVDALVDGDEVNREADRSNNLDDLIVRVLSARKPDIEVIRVEVLGEDGDETHAGFDGQVLQLRATFRNTGPVEARDVSLSLQVQFPLLERTGITLAPGEEVTLQTQWIAKHGNWIVQAIGLVGSGSEVTLANNERTWPLAILVGDVLAQVSPSSMHLEPGQTGQVSLHVSNDRSRPVVVTLVTPSNPDVLVSTLPVTLSLERGERRDVPLLVQASPFAREGVVQIPLLVSVGGPAPVAQATLSLTLGPRAGLLVDSDVWHGPPGAIEVPFHLTAPGNLSATANLAIEAPPEWTPRLEPRNLLVPAGESKTVVARLNIPASTAAGSYELPILADGARVGTLALKLTAAANFTAFPIAETQTLDGDIHILRIRNDGNAPGVPTVQVPEGFWLETPLKTLQAGQVMDVTLRRPSSGEPPVAQPAAEPGAWSMPEGTFAVGQALAFGVRVHNTGNETIAVPVRAFIDGQLLAERTVDVPPKSVQDVNFTWHASPGRHALTVLQGAGDHQQSRTVVLDVDSSRLPIPGVNALAALLGALALALLRRRKA